jgi:proteic killer suppression protein
MAIKSWACELTRELFDRDRNRIVPPQLVRRTRRKLLIIDAAAEIAFLRVPPGNRLEKLTGNREGQWSIRINDQYRICFVFRSGDAFQVEIVDLSLAKRFH